ncbi:hypothetical protein AAVH_29834, partial [Aphelenchoides avenae]
MSINRRTRSLWLLAVFVQPLTGLRYLTLPPWMSLISAKNATPVLQGNGTRPVDCIILALEKNLRPSFFFFEPAKSWCALYAAMQGYTMYGYAGRGYYVHGDDFYKAPSDVCPPISTLLYGMMNLAYGTHSCLQNPTPFTLMTDGTKRCVQPASKTATGPPAVGTYYAGAYGEFYSLSKELVRESLTINCNSTIASVAYNGSVTEPYCYAYFAYPNGTKPQATCDRKLPGSVVLVDSTGTPPPTPGFWGVFGYF